MNLASPSRLCLILILLSLAAGFQQVAAQAPQDSSHLFIVGHGWHVGIVVPRALLDAGQWPEAAAFPEVQYLEVGWGDAEYYPHPDPGPWTLLRAAIGPGPSVLHVAGLSRSPTEVFPQSEVLRLDISEGGLDSLMAYVQAAFARDEQGQSEAVAPGLYGRSAFYRAAGQYHVFNNCNHWTARALRAAGLRVSVTKSLTAGGLLRQLRRIGTVVQQRNTEGSAEQ
jgi:uncharacterized protein (TIGR02117 family)